MTPSQAFPGTLDPIEPPCTNFQHAISMCARPIHLPLNQCASGPSSRQAPRRSSRRRRRSSIFLTVFNARLPTQTDTERGEFQELWVSTTSRGRQRRQSPSQPITDVGAYSRKFDLGAYGQDRLCSRGVAPQRRVLRCQTHPHAGGVHRRGRPRAPGREHLAAIKLTPPA